MDWKYYLLNLLVFFFGYLTCQTFYFLKNTRASIVILKVVHIVALSVLTRCIEAYSHATYTKLSALTKTGVLPNDPIYIKVKHQEEEKVSQFKESSILALIAAHPQFLHRVIEFEDWNTAMNYLEENREIAMLFLSHGEDQ